jgi:prolyl oligopeptidase
LPDLLAHPPVTRADPITDVIHGVTVVDPYRWLEDGESTETREWIEQQTAFARDYLDGIDGREQIGDRIQQLLRVTNYDSVLFTSGRYIFRKRLPDQEQPCIYVREGNNGEDRLLVDPTGCGAEGYTAIRPLATSPDGKLLAYEVKEGGERAGRVEFVDLDTGHRLPEVLPHGHLGGLAFSPDSKDLFYSVDSALAPRTSGQLVYHHTLGDSISNDEVIFDAGSPEGANVGVIGGPDFQAILVQRAANRTVTDYYIRGYEPRAVARKILSDIDYSLSLQFAAGRVFALTDLDAPNYRVVELHFHSDGSHEFVELIPAGQRFIQQWRVVAGHIVLIYVERSAFSAVLFDFAGKQVGEVPLPEHATVWLSGASGDSDSLLFDCQSFFDSPSILEYSIARKELTTWATAAISLNRDEYVQRQVWYFSKDGTRVPMFLVGRRTILKRQHNPVILTSYGGFQVPMTPQFSVLVTCLMEMGCVFALANIRGGCEFGAEWHLAAQRHRRQTAFNDFLAAGEWLIEGGIGASSKIAIFGGSNSGLLVCAALTQRPALFRAVLCMAPLLDMIRYHLFDGARKWVDEYGTSEDPDDFTALWSYSPYHRVRDNVPYPAVMMISGNADQKCNPMHARKMIARLQVANSSANPIVLDYSTYRGHTPVLPLSVRIAALTDRVAFLCDQLHLDRRVRSN